MFQTKENKKALLPEMRRRFDLNRHFTQSAMIMLLPQIQNQVFKIAGHIKDILHGYIDGVFSKSDFCGFFLVFKLREVLLEAVNISQIIDFCLNLSVFHQSFP